ncbi:MAG TPA: Uma2 family endonuclease [Armatimonadota bacterium]|nr:Uma2 family endonuclease [Armatimonadota bacterium]
MAAESPIAGEMWPALPPLPEGEWPAQGKWTYEEYQRLPEVPARRFEVVCGVLWTTRAPTVSHETVVHRVAWELEQYQDRHPGDLVLSAPTEVLIPGLAEPVKPDLCYIRAERAGIVSGQLVQGPPDLVVEVLARRTGRLDRRIKRVVYERAGVAEYWMVDPRERTLCVLVLEEGSYILAGEHAPGDTVASRILPGLAFPVERIFRR